jgi:serine protease inhibitor
VKVMLSFLAVTLALAIGTRPVAAQTPPLAVTQEKPSETKVISPDIRQILETEQAKLAWELIERLSKSGNADVTISPASLVSAFAIVGDGANRPMKAAMIKALGFEPGQPARNLTALVEARAALAGDKSGLFQSADRIVLAPGAVPYPDLLARLDQLGIPHSAEDLSNPQAVAKIDAWVKEVTQGVIPEILGGPLDKASFVALNALHFKGRWKTPFDPKQTTPASFESAEGKRADVAMMHLGDGERAFRTEGNFIGVDLPFSSERFSLVVVTTTDKPASVKGLEKAADWLTGAGFVPRKGDLALPRFKLSERSELLPVLDPLGLAEGHRSPTALAGYGSGTVLTQVIQRASIEVDEEGAEAAAASAVIGMRALARDERLHMVVDKPFIFALRDRETGLILVAGYVGHAPVQKVGL